MYYIREDEEQRYGRNKPTQINHAYINSGEYRRKFDNLTDSKVINKLIYKNAKEMLFHRSGTCLKICAGLVLQKKRMFIEKWMRPGSE